ncbi:MAG TPA: glucose-6-phosphate isomerase, partial [Blastocatellia bacterium]
MGKINQSEAWKALEAHQKEISGRHMREMFAEDPDRFNRFSLRFGDILLDYSKNLVAQETLSLLFNLAREVDLKSWIEK